MKKKIAISLGIVGVIAIGAIVFNMFQKDDSEIVQDTISDNSTSEIVLLIPEDEDSNEESSTTEIIKPNIEEEEIDISGTQVTFDSDYTYDPDKYDSSTPTGTVIIEGETPGVGGGTYTGLLDNIDYNYAVRDVEFSRGYALNLTSKYTPSVIGTETLSAIGPNYTNVTFKELDNTEGDLDYWHTWVFTHIGFTVLHASAPEGVIPYGTPFKECEGEYYNAEYGYQLISDDKLDCRYGEGYLTEYYIEHTGEYTAEAVLVNYNGRIIWLKATSPYQPSLKDIIMEFADTCIHLY